jgi:hypothetical protein
MRCTDCYTGHNHWDQGSFVIYRKGLLALDAGFYKKAHGPQKKTGNHNTLLFGGEGQRQVRPRYNTSVESYLRDLKPGPRSFETGNVLFHEDRPGWAAVAGEFGQAYDPAVVGRVVRQLLYVRPGTVAVVDHIGGAGGKPLPEISWLLHLPSEPKAASGSLSAGNGKAWIRCRRLLPGGADPQLKPGPSTQVSAKGKIPTWEVCYKYPGRPSLTLVHLLEVGDGAAPTAASPAKAEVTPEGLVLTLAGAKFLFSARAPYGISETKR